MFTGIQYILASSLYNHAFLIRNKRWTLCSEYFWNQTSSLGHKSVPMIHYKFVCLLHSLGAPLTLACSGGRAVNIKEWGGSIHPEIVLFHLFFLFSPPSPSLNIACGPTLVLPAPFRIWSPLGWSGDFASICAVWAELSCTFLWMKWNEIKMVKYGAWGNI